MNESYINWPNYYDLYIEVVVECVTYILFVSSNEPTDLLLNCVAVLFLAEMDEFLGIFIHSLITISVIREYVLLELK